MPRAINYHRISNMLMALAKDVPFASEGVQELAYALRELERIINLTVEPPLGMYDSATGRHLISRQPKQDIVAKIVCLALNTINGVPRAYYGWIQQEFQPDGTFRDLIGGLKGSTTVNPAFERNGDLDVEIGTIVRLQRSYSNSGQTGYNLPTQDQEWIFDARVTPIVAQIVSPTGGGTTTLNGGITNVALALTATAFAGFPADQPFFIQIDAEIIQVTAGNCTTGWTIVRAQQGTVAAVHLNLAAITQVAPPYSWQEVEEMAMGQFTAVAGGRTGTLSLYPAFERNGGATVPIGYYVLLWPGFQDFGLVCGVATTTINLVGGINTTDQSVVVTSTVGFPTAPFYIDIDGTETMLVTKVTGTTFTIVRAAKACVTAVSHANGATVTLLLSRLQEWIFDACCTSSSVVTNLTTITNTYAQRKPLLPYDLELKPVRGVRGSTGATGATGPLGPASQDDYCCEETTIIQQVTGGKNVVCGVQRTVRNDALVGGYTVEWEGVLDTTLYNTYSMWEASPYPTRVTIKESGHYSISVLTEFDIVLYDGLWYDWVSVYGGPFLNGGATPTSSSNLPFIDQWFIASTGATPSASDFPWTWCGYGEGYFNAGDYIELYFAGGGNGGGVSPPSGTNLNGPTTMIVRKTDKAG